MGGVMKKVSNELGLTPDPPPIIIPPAPPPVVLPPKEMPVPLPDDAAAQQARRRSLARQFSRRGRSSTVLADDGETLG